MLGAGWDGNPNAYAGNNPLNASDPTGLRPLSDDELKAYDGSAGGAIAAAGDWLGGNWEYIAGGAMVIAGGVLIATGVGGLAGMMLIGAGASTIIQKATTGDVNWGEVALSGALGGFGGFGTAALASRAGFTGMKSVVATGVSSGGISGGIEGTYGYCTSPGPHTVAGAFGATAQGTVFGAATGGIGGAAGQKIGQSVMAKLTVRPDTDTVAIGRWMEGRVTPYANSHEYGYYSGTPGWLRDPMEGLRLRAGEESVTRQVLTRVESSVDKTFNQAWINTQVNTGRKIVDIGVELDSPFYQIERNVVSGYPGYSKDFQSNSDLRVEEALGRPQ